MVGTNIGKCEWDWEEKLLWLNPRWWNSNWQNSRWLPPSSWVRMNEWIFLCKMDESKMAEINMAAIITLSQNQWVMFLLCKWWELILANVSEFEKKCKDGWMQDGQIQDGRIQDGCHDQVKREWRSLSQIELVWVRVRVEWRVVLSESERRKEGVWIQDGSVWILHGRIQDGCHHQVESEWMSEVFFCAKWLGSNLGKMSRWVWEEKLRWLNPRMAKFNDGCHHQVQCRMNEFESRSWN